MKDDLFTVGELAKKMNVTVRTLQYYDKEGLLNPAARSEGGRRLYTKKDMVLLYQILSMKYLGFSLEEIKNNLISLDNPKDIYKLLEEQTKAIEYEIDNLNRVLEAIKALKKSVTQTNAVDFNRYADIVSLIRTKNEGFLSVEFFNEDEELATHIKGLFEDNPEIGIGLFQQYQQMCDKTISLKAQDKTPDSKEGQILAKEWWDLIFTFTGGNMELLPGILSFSENRENWSEGMRTQQKAVDEFMEEALSIYFQKNSIDFPELEEGYND